MAIETLLFTGAPGDPGNPANTGFTAFSLNDPGSSITFDPAATPWKPRYRPSIIVVGSDQAGQVFGMKDIAATDTFAFDQPWRPLVLGASPNPDNQIFYLGNLETRQFSINALSTGGLRVRDASGTQTNSPTGILVPGDEYVLKVFASRHATDGSWHVKLMNEAETVTIWDSGLQTGKPMGANPFNRFRAAIGKQGTTSVTPAQHQYGEPRYDRAATGLLPKFTLKNPFWVWNNNQYVQAYLWYWDDVTDDYIRVDSGY